MKERLCLIGLDQAEYEIIRDAYNGPIMWLESVPKIVVSGEKLFVESNKGLGMLLVDKVVYHGIYDDDFDFLSGLAMWDGKCFPNPYAMMNCRLKLPCLVRALRASNFASKRGYISKDTALETSSIKVAKWGNWHCGENKEKFTGTWMSQHSSIIEPFFEGEAVRIILIGEQAWQIKLEGEDWLKSIHSDKAGFMEIDQELLADTIQIRDALEMNLIANDYIVGKDGKKHLLEVNHIPNVTRFEELRKAYLDFVVKDFLGEE